MRLDRTDITLIVDRSGSMEQMRTDAEGGVNAFVRRQVAEPGEAVVTLVQFDTEYEFLHKGVPAAAVGEYTLVPRGGTALLDALGRAIDETGARLAALPEAERPGLVVFVIVTDGEENSSREYTRAAVRERIQHQQEVYRWQFTFLGASPEAFAEAGSLGIHAGGAAAFAPAKARKVFGFVGEKVAAMRKGVACSAPVDNSWSEEDRAAMR